MSTAASDAPRDMHADFDIEDPSLAERFDEVLDDLLTHCPVARSTIGDGYYVISRYTDVRRCAMDWRTFSSADGWLLNAPPDNIPILPEDSDPPYHNDWRKVLNPYFTQNAVTELDSFARVRAGELLDGFKGSGECEFIADFAAKLPGQILFEKIMPVPVADLPTLFKDIDIFSFGPLAERGPAFGRVHGYLEAFLEGRTKQPPQGDIVDYMVAGVDKDGAPCPWEDKVAIALDVVFGGLATTTHTMSGAIYHLAAHPDIRRDLVANPDLVGNAVEEIIRLYAPVVAPARTVRADIEVAGTQMKAGDRVALNFAAASRDPEACPNPGMVDIRRAEIVHTAFGVGPHRCLGEHLARLEVRVAIEEFLKRIPEFELKPGTKPSYESGQLRTMRDLHLRWEPRGQWEPRG